jgi:predicted nucleotidyltransferase
VALTNHERVGKALELLNVFGSQARGDARPDSDLDLLVVEPTVADRFAEMARLSTLLGRRLIPADVVVMSADAFEQQKGVPWPSPITNASARRWSCCKTGDGPASSSARSRRIRNWIDIYQSRAQGAGTAQNRPGRLLGAR